MQPVCKRCCCSCMYDDCRAETGRIETQVFSGGGFLSFFFLLLPLRFPPPLLSSFFFSCVAAQPGEAARIGIPCARFCCSGQSVLGETAVRLNRDDNNNNDDAASPPGGFVSPAPVLFCGWLAGDSCSPRNDKYRAVRTEIRASASMRCMEAPSQPQPAALARREEVLNVDVRSDSSLLSSPLPPSVRDQAS